MMWPTGVCLLLLLLTSRCGGVRLSQDTVGLSGLVETGKRPGLAPYLSIASRGFRWCAKQCKRRPKCRSFSYTKADLACHLYHLTSAQTSLTDDDNYLFSDSDSWPNNVIGACGNFSCSDSARCEVDAFGDPVCILTECANAPAPVTNAVLVDTETHEIGRTAAFVCSTGYIMVGNDFVTCKPSGQWSPAAFHCRDCGNPPGVSNASPTGSSRTVGSTMTYVCNVGILQNGPATSVCDAQGVWSTPTFYCLGFRTSISGDSGIVMSTYWPQNYHNYEDYTITITLDRAGPSNVALSIQYETETSFDYMTIAGVTYTGAGSTSTTITVADRTWTVHFYSDLSSTKKGFLITYNVV